MIVVCRGSCLHALTMLLLTSAAGCSQQPTDQQPVGAGGASESDATARTAEDAGDGVSKDLSVNGNNSSAPEQATKPVTVQVADRAGYERLLQQHRGKVVLADFWATWCIPCVKQFEHTVELHQKYAPKGLAVISVSLDEPDDRESVQEFLAQKGATFDNLLSSSGAGNEAFRAFEIENGALPHYKLYDRQGKLRKTFAADPLATKQFTSEDIEHAVQELLAE